MMDVAVEGAAFCWQSPIVMLDFLMFLGHALETSVAGVRGLLGLGRRDATKSLSTASEVIAGVVVLATIVLTIAGLVGLIISRS